MTSQAATVQRDLPDPGPVGTDPAVDDVGADGVVVTSDLRGLPGQT